MKSKESIEKILSELKSIINKDFNYNAEEIAHIYNNNRAYIPNKLIAFLSIIGGLFGALSFMIYLVLMFNSDIYILISLGALLLGASFFVNKKAKDISRDTLVIGLYICGIILFCGGLFNLIDNDKIVTLILLAISLISMLIINNSVLSFINLLIANACILYLIYDKEILLLLYSYLMTIGLIYLAQNEPKLLANKGFFNKNYQVLLLATIVNFLVIYFWQSKGFYFFEKGNMVFVYISSIAPIFGILYMQYSLFQKIHFKSLNLQILSYILMAIVLIVTIPFPLISAAILVIFLSFAISFYTGMSLGIFAALYGLIQYYYDLEFTLLHKSISLVIAGLVFLLMYFLASKKILIEDEKL